MDFQNQPDAVHHVYRGMKLAVDFDKNSEIGYMTALELREAYASGKLSSVEVTTAVLERIAEVNPALNAFTVVMAEEALRDAAKADKQRREGHDAPLLGVPVTIKDVYDVAGIKTEMGSKWLSATNRSPRRTMSWSKDCERPAPWCWAKPPLRSWPGRA